MTKLLQNRTRLCEYFMEFTAYISARRASCFLTYLEENFPQTPARLYGVNRAGKVVGVNKQEETDMHEESPVSFNMLGSRWNASYFANVSIFFKSKTYLKKTKLTWTGNPKFQLTGTKCLKFCKCSRIFTIISFYHYPDSKVHGANMGLIWGRQDPGGPHVGPMNLAIWVLIYYYHKLHQIYGIHWRPMDSPHKWPVMRQLC